MSRFGFIASESAVLLLLTPALVMIVDSGSLDPWTFLLFLGFGAALGGPAAIAAVFMYQAWRDAALPAWPIVLSIPVAAGVGAILFAAFDAAGAPIAVAVAVAAAAAGGACAAALLPITRRVARFGPPALVAGLLMVPTAALGYIDAGLADQLLATWPLVLAYAVVAFVVAQIDSLRTRPQPPLAEVPA